MCVYLCRSANTTVHKTSVCVSILVCVREFLCMFVSTFVCPDALIIFLRMQFAKCNKMFQLESYRLIYREITKMPTDESYFIEIVKCDIK